MEIPFSIRERQILQGLTFASAKQLREHIDALIEAQDSHAEPFVCNKARVYRRRVKNGHIGER